MSLSSGASFLVEELCGRTLSHAIYDGASQPRVCAHLLLLLLLLLLRRWNTDALSLLAPCSLYAT